MLKFYRKHEIRSLLPLLSLCELTSEKAIYPQHQAFRQTFAICLICYQSLGMEAFKANALQPIPNINIIIRIMVLLLPHLKDANDFLCAHNCVSVFFPVGLFEFVCLCIHNVSVYARACVSIA